jgi:hypothetical protein
MHSRKGREQKQHDAWRIEYWLAVTQWRQLPM